ncbi:MAG TPA: AMP-binding protein, partial [Novosphingobium sp.]
MYVGTHAETHPEKIAVFRPSTGESLTYRALDDRSNRLAQLLHAHGLRRGDHVALYLETHLAFFEVIWACMRSGLYLTPINRYLPAAEAAYIVDDCDARVLIASAAIGESVELGRLSPRCEIKLSVGGGIEGFEDYDTAIARYPAEKLAEEPLGTFMLYSSGTTGKPKGIKRPLQDLPAAGGSPGSAMTVGMFGIDGNAVYLSPAPLYHSAPCGYVTGVTQLGGTVVMMDKFEA